MGQDAPLRLDEHHVPALAEADGREELPEVALHVVAGRHRPTAAPSASFTGTPRATTQRLKVGDR